MGVQHTGSGTLLNVGHGATSLWGDWTCVWEFGYGDGVTVDEGRARTSPRRLIAA